MALINQLMALIRMTMLYKNLAEVNTRLSVIGLYFQLKYVVE